MTCARVSKVVGARRPMEGKRGKKGRFNSRFLKPKKKRLAAKKEGSARGLALKKKKRCYTLRHYPLRIAPQNGPTPPTLRSAADQHRFQRSPCSGSHGDVLWEARTPPPRGFPFNKKKTPLSLRGERLLHFVSSTRKSSCPRRRGRHARTPVATTSSGVLEPYATPPTHRRLLVPEATRQPPPLPPM
jgi:hypothetical protein